MITLFGKPEPTLIERLKESVGKTKEALADTLDTITQGGRQIDPSVQRSRNGSAHRGPRRQNHA